jgi:hypothetical protein
VREHRRTLLRRSSVTSVILAIASVPLIAACTPPRAEMFTAVLFAAYVNLLWHYHLSGEGPLWLLPILMCLVGELALGIHCRSGNVRRLTSCWNSRMRLRLRADLVPCFD